MFEISNFAIKMGQPVTNHPGLDYITWPREAVICESSKCKGYSGKLEKKRNDLDIYMSNGNIKVWRGNTEELGGIL